MRGSLFSSKTLLYSRGTENHGFPLSLSPCELIFPKKGALLLMTTLGDPLIDHFKVFSSFGQKKV